METSTVLPISGDAGVGNLQRIHPASNSGRRKRPQPRVEARKKPKGLKDTTYTPEGRVSSAEHGLRVDISA